MNANTKQAHTRQSWDAQIQEIVATLGDPTNEFSDMNQASQEVLEDLLWDGPSFEDWRKGKKIYEQHN